MPLSCANRPVGFIPTRLSWIIDENPHLFSRGVHDVSLATGKQKELDEFVKRMYNKKVFTGWRGELYAGRALDGRNEQLFHVERAFARVFGLVRIIITPEPAPED